MGLGDSSNEKTPKYVSFMNIHYKNKIIKIFNDDLILNL